jgi:hypothetical protein
MEWEQEFNHQFRDLPPLVQKELKAFLLHVQRATIKEVLTLIRLDKKADSLLDGPEENFRLGFNTAVAELERLKRSLM